MNIAFWLLLFAFAAVAAWLVRHSLRKWQARERAEEERIASFIAGNAAGATPKPAALSPAPPPAVPADTAPPASNGLAQQKLLFEAAHKAGEAGEAALAIQLYGRLLARYPATAFAQPARAAAEGLKKKLVKA